MSGYTPTTDEVRLAYNAPLSASSRAAFDRWLAGVKAEAIRAAVSAMGRVPPEDQEFSSPPEFLRRYADAMQASDDALPSADHRRIGRVSEMATSECTCPTKCVAGIVRDFCESPYCDGVCEPIGNCDCPLHADPVHENPADPFL